MPSLLHKHLRSLQILIITSLFYLLSLASSAQEQPLSPLIQSYQVHSKMKANSPYGLEWIQLGPTLNGARVEAVAADPSQIGTLYVAFGSGGLWKTINNGLSWKPIFENMPSLGIGDIALAPSDPNIIYVGTGESLKKARNFTMPGTGMYRSNDGGANWEHLGLNDSWHIGEITVHPENPDIVLVAVQGHFWSSNTNRGIFRTEDGGENWEHVLSIDLETGANDVVFSPADPKIAYASMWHNYPDVHGSNSAIYKSDDSGKTWTKSSHGIKLNKNTGRIGIAASFQDKNKAYAFIDQRNRNRKHGAGEIYKTIDGGANWIKTHEEDIFSLSALGWYFMDIYVNPQQDEEIYALGVGLIHSEDGGKTFKNVKGEISHLSPSPAQTLHLDHCELWINPDNPKELLLGNDGGLYRSYDKGKSWLHYNNIPTGEFYDIAVDKKEPYNIYGGTQDDATVFGPAKALNLPFNDEWEYLWIDAWSGGDGCITLIDPNDSNTVYFSMQNGGARRMDLQKGSSVGIRARIKKVKNIQYNFITPYILSPHNSNRMYMAGNYVMRSDNRGDEWSLISPDLTKLNKTKKEEIGAGALAESTLEEGTLYVGTDKGSVWRTKDSGANWENISKGLPSNYVRCIYPSTHKAGRVYLQQTGINYDDFTAYLFVSEDYGDHWKSISNNLPNHPINAILEDPDYENILYAATYRGVYISDDFGKEWNYFGNNLPDASIADLLIEERTKDLVIATHGRGIYKVNLKPFYAKVNAPTDRNLLFSIPTAKYPKRRDTHRDIDQSSLEKVVISFWLEEDETVIISVTDSTNTLFWTHAMDAKKGFNQYRWDLVFKHERSNQPYFIHDKSYLPVGAYQLKIEGKAWFEKKEFIVE